MGRRWLFLSVLSLAALMIAVPVSPSLQGALAINFSASLPRGVYVRCAGAPEAGSLIEFELPKTSRSDTPGHDPGRRYPARLLKPIAATGGDQIDTTGAFLLIDGRRVAPMTTHDSHGNPLPVWRAKRTLTADEFFVFSDRVPNSLDSRHFGPIRRNQTVCVRRPWLIWE